MRFARVGLLALVVATVGASALVVAAIGSSSPPSVADLSPVRANVKSPGYAPSTVLSAQLAQVQWAHGSSKLENPAARVVSYYGYDDGPMVPLPSAPTLRRTRRSRTRTRTSCSKTD